MSSNILTVTELIGVLTTYCVAFCPILCWVIRGSASLEKSIVVSTASAASLLQQ